MPRKPSNPEASEPQTQAKRGRKPRPFVIQQRGREDFDAPGVWIDNGDYEATSTEDAMRQIRAQATADPVLYRIVQVCKTFTVSAHQRTVTDVEVTEL